MPKQIKIETERTFRMKKGNDEKRIQKFEADIESPLYELQNTATEIVNQEIKFCNFDYVNYMMLYPEYDIDKKAVGEGETSSKIYIVGDRTTGKKLYLAIRSCAFPPGM
jgi:hypothetical protein